MKREILFRGKRVANGEWVEGEIHEGSDYVQIFEKPKDQRLYGKVYYVHPETVGQYTGLTDKNGTKIFEGDSFKVWLEDSVEARGGFWWVCEVKMHRGCWILAQVGYDYSETPLNECEILHETNYKLIQI